MKPALPDVLPSDPMPLLEQWLAEATGAIRNAIAMTLATVEPDGRPAARMVLCRGLDARAGWLVFYTDRGSDKGRALATNPRAAAVFHWDAFERQVRVEGPVTLAPEADSDAYWASRPREARVAAAASEQSHPVVSRAAFLSRVAETAARFDGDVPRPERWGGYRIWAERIELWVGQPGRAHDRARWVRALEPAADGFRGGPWHATRLQP